MMIEDILRQCDTRQLAHKGCHCQQCTYDVFCPTNCEKCLDYIHNPSHAPVGAPDRKYDCTHMADFYTCKYSCRYTSEMIYALRRLRDLSTLPSLRVLSFGCGPCTDLFALEYLCSNGCFSFENIEYRGIDYSKDVWSNIHHDLKALQTDNFKIKFYYQNACEIIETISQGAWIPNLVVFQYVFSDMKKHTDSQEISRFIDSFSDFFNDKMLPKSYIVLNDINLSINYGGGREYFDRLYNKLENAIMRKGRFRDDNARSSFYPHGYTYGEESDGEFPDNSNLFDLIPWHMYSPFNTCASAQMLIKKEV